MKVTAIAPSNIAFIKYWGKTDDDLRIPTNDSISMNLSNLATTTTVEFSSQLEIDDITINGVKKELQIKRVINHLDRIRNIAGTATKATVVTKNSFPTGTGLSSSASGFAALTVAACAALGIEKSERELSILARMGSGSACRSIPNGFVEWHKGNSSETSYAESIYSSDWWDIVDLVICISDTTKIVPTSTGQKLIHTSPFFNERLNRIDAKIDTIKKAINARDFEIFGQMIEEEALELHAIMMTSTPPLIYMFPQTLAVIQCVMQLRQIGNPVYFTLNTGHNVHVITLKKSAELIKKELKRLFPGSTIIENEVCNGAHIIDTHLF